jgi:hypothetical protein
MIRAKQANQKKEELVFENGMKSSIRKSGGTSWI